MTAFGMKLAVAVCGLGKESTVAQKKVVTHIAATTPNSVLRDRKLAVQTKNGVLPVQYLFEERLFLACGE